MKHLVCLLFLSCLALPADASTIIWDYGPSSGVFATSYSNMSGVMYFADRIVFTSAMVVDGYVHFTNATVSGSSFEFRVLADDGGRPGAPIATFHQAYPGSPPFEGSFGSSSIWRVAFQWAAPVRLGPGAYWIGASGEGFNAVQFAVNRPGDGQMAQFGHGAYTGMASGDQLFQLSGYQDTACPEPRTTLLAAAAAILAAQYFRIRRRRG